MVARPPRRPGREKDFDTLQGLKAGDSLFLLQPAMLADARLTRSPQEFSVSGCSSATTLRPSTLTFLAAFQSLRWCVLSIRTRWGIRNDCLGAFFFLNL